MNVDLQNMVFEPSPEFKAQANLQLPEYEELLKQAQNQPEQFWSKLALNNLSWIQEFDENSILDASKAPFYKYFKNGKINISYNCIDRHLTKHGNKAALIWEGEPGDKKSFSYAELHKAVCKTANMLKELGVKKGDIVCIYMPLIPEAVIAMQACVRIGAVHSVVFAGFSANALRDRMLDGKAKLLITADGLYRKGSIISLISIAEEALAGLDCVEKLLCYDRIAKAHSEIDSSKSKLKNSKTNFLYNWTELFEKQSDKCQPEAMNGDDPSFILYTSGSTGKPKGIQHSTAGYLLWVHLTCKWVFDLKDTDVYWCTADLGWITGHSYLCYGPLSNAASCVMYEGAPNFPEANRFWDIIEKYRVSIFYTAPTAIRAFMQWGLEHVNKHNLSSLRLLGTVGEPINPSVWLWYYQNIGKEQCPIVDTWWQTETGGILITTLPGIQNMQPGSAGLALPGINADINEEGLLNIKSAWASMLMTVYGDDQRYLDTYWSRIKGAYTAGDGAHKDSNGYITITGRIDDVINVSGHRLGSAEIESALVSHELVAEAAVVAIPHELKGQGIVAYVVLLNGQNGSQSSELQKQYESKLKEHVVKEIGAIARPEKLIVCSALPKTRSGKILRRLLRNLAQGEAVSGDLSTIENAGIINEIMQTIKDS